VGHDDAGRYEGAQSAAHRAVPTYPGRAVVPDGAERERIWAEVTAAYPFFAEHQARVSRTIPVVVLERRADG
jgi:F420H(2)-dependent quinone reductase